MSIFLIFVQLFLLKFFDKIYFLEWAQNFDITK
jgi:hypothetical protein